MLDKLTFSPAPGLDDLRKAACALPGPLAEHRGGLLKMLDRIEALESEMRDFTRAAGKPSPGSRPAQPLAPAPSDPNAVLHALITDPTLGDAVRRRMAELQQARLR